MAEPEQAIREKEVFERSFDIASAEERLAYLRSACGEDAALFDRVQALLRAQQTALGFLSDQAPSVSQLAVVTEKPGDKIGRYKLLEKIGEGGCGVVYLAEQEEPVRRRVALKVIKLGMDTRAVIARFEAERQALARMDHPNIAKVLDAGATDTGRPYFVMEMVRGVRITRYCVEANLKTVDRLRLFILVCQAIQHAHQKGIIHRDIKPSNILVTVNDGAAMPKVIDFGIAKATEGRLTEKTLFTTFAQFMGTPAYMSPEQASLTSVDIDTRSDIYSLGVLLFELLTGQTPFDTQELLRAGFDNLRQTIREEEPPRPSTRLIDSLAAAEPAKPASNSELDTTAHQQVRETIRLLRGDLDWIVMKCLEKDRARRYQTANGLAMDIHRYLVHEPIIARPPTVRYQIRKFVRRNKVVAAASLAVAVSLLLGTGVSLRQAAQAQRLQREAEASRALSEKRLFDSLLGQAHAIRMARPTGYRGKVFQLLRQARALDLPGKDLAKLRADAVGCLGDFAGFAPVRWTNFPPATSLRNSMRVDRLDPSGSLAAFPLSDRSVQLRELPSGRVVAELKGERGLESLRFGTDTNQIVAIYQPEGDTTAEQLESARLHVWTRQAGAAWAETETSELPGGYECLRSKQSLLLAVASGTNHSVSIVDSRTKEVVFQIPYPAEMDEPPIVAISPDGDYFVYETLDTGGSHRRHLEVRDRKTWTSLQQVTPLVGKLVGLIYSPDGQYLACIAITDGAIYAMPKLEKVAEIRAAFSRGLTFSLAGNATVVALPLFPQNRVRIWDWARGESLALLDEPMPVDGATLGPDGTFLLTTSSLGATLYPLVGPAERIELPSHPGAASACFNPDGSRIVSVGSDRSLVAGNATNGQLIWRAGPLEGDGRQVTFSPNSRFLATACSDPSSIDLWDASTGVHLLSLESGRAGGTWSAAFSPDSRYLATASAGLGTNQAVRIWEIKERAPSGAQPELEAKLIKTQPGKAWSLTAARDTWRVAYITRPRNVAGELYAWDPGASEPPRLLSRDIRKGGMSQLVSLNADGSRVVTVNSERVITVIDVSTGQMVLSLPTIPKETVLGSSGPAILQLSPDGNRLAISTSNNLGVEIWDLVQGKLLYPLPDGIATVQALSWSPENRRLIVSRANGDVSEWNLLEIEQVLTNLGLTPELAR